MAGVYDKNLLHNILTQPKLGITNPSLGLLFRYFIIILTTFCQALQFPVNPTCLIH